MLRVEATRILYDEIGFDTTSRNAEKEIRRTLSLYRTFCHNPSLAYYVHSFYLGVNIELSVQGLWEAISTMVPMFTELKKLACWHALPLGIPAATLLDGCSFQLESFLWIQDYEPFLSGFLDSQPLIQYLYLGYCPKSTRVQLSSTSLPKLRMLTGDLTILESILPWRPVTHLHWISHPRISSNTNISHIIPALASVRVLNYYGGWSPLPELQLVAKHLNNVRVLLWDVRYNDEVRIPLIYNTVIFVVCSNCCRAEGNSFFNSLEEATQNCLKRGQSGLSY